MAMVLPVIRKDAGHEISHIDQVIPVLAALVYGSFGDIQVTLVLTYQLYDILCSSGLRELSQEVQNILRVLEAFHTNTTALMQYLGTVSFIDLSNHAQRITDKVSAELQVYESLMEKLKDKVASCSGFCRSEAKEVITEVKYPGTLVRDGLASQVSSNTESHRQKLEHMGTEVGDVRSQGDNAACVDPLVKCHWVWGGRGQWLAQEEEDPDIFCLVEVQASVPQLKLEPDSTSRLISRSSNIRASCVRHASLRHRAWSGMSALALRLVQDKNSRMRTAERWLNNGSNCHERRLPVNHCIPLKEYSIKFQQPSRTLRYLQ
ncbi:hypothetical protein DFH08DRAFT_826240 [Mycena albidolilacea]|uniref:Uncharacterized protein n=1 Tax=Mycena albidolilacea TaxID=1033008 RepID=A0AAD6Z111_9AGAR|nr:hypothetical protein DFH08DRAFT_826240 [Mycena albidolilacea]